MVAEIFPGLGFWFNWVLGALVIAAAVTLVVAYNVMARKAPPLQRGQRTDEHVLHGYRYYVGFVGALSCLALLGLTAVRVDSHGGWLLVFFVVLMIFGSVAGGLYFKGVKFENPTNNAK